MAQEIVDEEFIRKLGGFLIYRYPEWEYKRNSRRTYDFTKIFYDLFTTRKLTSKEIVKYKIPEKETLRYFDIDAKRMTTIKLLQSYPAVKLKEGGTIWMTTDPLELDMMLHYGNLSRGDVLAGGLGLGIYQFFIGKNPSVRKIDTVEINTECIELVRAYVPKTKIIEGDFWEYIETTEKRYDTVFVDIWAGVIPAYEEYKRAKEKVKKVLKPGGISIIWLEELFKVIEEKLPKEPTHPRPAGSYEPCLVCGKILRYDYGGLCMDCADGLGVSELFLR